MLNPVGVPGLLMLLIVAAIMVIPFWKILPRAGIPSWVALLAILPVVPIILLWVLAFKKWPGDNA